MSGENDRNSPPPSQENEVILVLNKDAIVFHVDNTYENHEKQVQRENSQDAILSGSTPNNSKPNQYKQYPYRWVVLILFCTFSFMNSVLWICFAPIVTTTANYFNVNETAINALSAVFMLLFLPGSIMNSYLMSQYGLRFAVLFSAGLQAFASWLRYVAADNDAHGRAGGYGALFLGQFISGLAQPAFTNACTKLSGDWFSESQMAIATTIASMANIIGVAFAQVFPSIMVSDDGAGMPSFLLVQALVTTGILIVGYFFFRNAPPTPPSLSAHNRILQQFESHEMAPTGWRNHPLVAQGKLMMSDRNFRFLTFGFGIGLGLFNALVSVIAQLVSPVGYSQTDSGNFGAAVVVAGMVGAAILGPILDKTHKYNQVLKFVAICTAISVLYLILSLQANQFGLVVSGFVAIGLFALPLLPISLECSAECTYPLNEELASAFLMTAGNYCGVICTFAFGALATLDTIYSVITPIAIVLMLMIITALISLLMYNGPTNRTDTKQLSSEPGTMEASRGAVSTLIDPSSDSTVRLTVATQFNATENFSENKTGQVTVSQVQATCASPSSSTDAQNEQESPATIPNNGETELQSMLGLKDS